MELLQAYRRHFAAFHPDAKRFLALTFLTGLGGSIFSLVFNLYILSLGHSAAVVGTLQSITPGVSALLSLPLAFYAARITFDRAIRISAVLTFAGFLALSLAMAARSLALAQAVLGVSAAIAGVTSWPLMLALTSDEERPFLFSLHFFLMTASGFCGSLLSGLIADRVAPMAGLATGSAECYRAALVAGAAVTALAVIPAFRIGRLASPGASAPPNLSSMRWRRLGKLIIPQLGIGYGAGMVLPFMNIFLAGKFGLAAEPLGVIFSISSIVTGLGSLAAPAVVGRLGRIPTIVLFQVLSLPFLVMLGFSDTLSMTLAGFWARMALMNAGGPVYSMFVMESVPERQRPLAAAFYGLAWNLTWSSGSRTSGALQMRYGFDVPFSVMLACYAMASALIWLWFGRGRGLLGETGEVPAGSAPAG